MAARIALIGGVILYLVWAWAGYAVHIAGAGFETLPVYFFRIQDLPVLIGQAVALAAMLALSGGGARYGARAPQPPRVLPIAAAIGGVALAAWLGRGLVFHHYSPSRDEVMVELASAYLADGRVGWPIPAAWQPYARAMLPEFYSPYGAAETWTSIYLPVHAAIRALFVRLGAADLAAPVMLAAGLVALYSVARRLFPGRGDAVMVAMAMALTSTQLLATAMTPYAMTSHFALNMIWLALVLRGGVVTNLLAAVVLVAAAGLHQWHFPALFAGPFILWLAWRRQWMSALVQAGALGAAVVLWARLWPHYLASLLGPPLGGAERAAPGIGAKIESLFGRLDKWQPLLNIGRLMAWNNPLLVPLAALGLTRMNWWPRAWLRDPPIILPLLGTVLIGFALALYQGYGWGFRYMHGQLGALCLLAGFGWTRISREGRRPLRLIWASCAAAAVAGAFLLVTTEHYVRGYARTMQAIRASDADVVLVDLRGGYFMTDLVRFADGRPGRPAVMALGHVSHDGLRRLCAEHSVAVLDHPQFWRMGVHPITPLIRDGGRLSSRQSLLHRIGCYRPVLPPPGPVPSR